MLLRVRRDTDMLMKALLPLLAALALNLAPAMAAEKGDKKSGKQPAEPAALPKPDAEGFLPLFNGRSLAGFVQVGGHAKYRVEDGQIVGQCVPNTPNSFLCTERHYTNFILEVEFKVSPTLNSGIQIRSRYYDHPQTYEWQGKTINVAAGRVHGYQVEIDPSPRAWSGGIYDEGRRGWLNDLKARPEAGKAFKQGEWNKFRVECRGDSIKTWINGVAGADLKDGYTPSGLIALQVHGVGNKVELLEVRWRAIRVKELL